MELKEQTNGLIENIRKEAEAEAADIIEQAEKDAEASLNSAKTRSEQLWTSARERAAEQAAESASGARSKISMEKKRIALENQEGIYEAAVSAALERIREHAGTPEYRTTVLNWLSEAAAGLGTDTALVRGDARALDHLDSAMLSEAEKRASKAAGKAITLKLMKDAPPLEGTGIRVSDPSGRLAWDNRLRVRLTRKKHEIRRIVSTMLEEEEQSR